jgi:hypothetical protein
VSRDTQLPGIVSTIVAVLVAVLSTVLPPVYPDQLRALPIVVLVLLVVAAALFLLVVPRASRSDRPAVAGPVCSILGLLLVVAFWSGLPIVLGTAGFYWEGRIAPQGGAWRLRRHHRGSRRHLRPCRLSCGPTAGVVVAARDFGSNL